MTDIADRIVSLVASRVAVYTLGAALAAVAWRLLGPVLCGAILLGALVDMLRAWRNGAV